MQGKKAIKYHLGVPGMEYAEDRNPELVPKTSTASVAPKLLIIIRRNPFCSLPNNTAFIGRKFQLLPAPAIAPLRHIAHPKPIRLVFLSLLPHFPAEGGLACMHCCESCSGWRWDLRHVSSALGAAPHDAFAKAPAKPPPAVLISLFPLSGTKSHSGV